MPRSNRADDSSFAPANQSDLFKQSLYGKLTTPDAFDKSAADAEKAKKKGKFFGHANFYFWLCAFTAKHFVKKKKQGYAAPEESVDTDSKGRTKKAKKKKKELPKNYREAFDFLGPDWKLDDDVVMAAPRTAGILALILGVIIAGIAYPIVTTTPKQEAKCGDGYCVDDASKNYIEGIADCPQDCDQNARNGAAVKTRYPEKSASPILLLFILFIPIFLTLAMVTYVQKYPIAAAEAEKMRALTYVPEIMNYMVMQMRLQPNLERAVEFAAEHGEGRIANEFKDLLWQNRTGRYDSMEEGLDEMAYRWEPYSEEFKHAITMIRSSVLVPSDAERNIIYDSVIEDLLDSTKEKMGLYAHSMKQPSMYLFYIAVLLPLMIIIMLPVAAAFANMPVASTPILSFLYLILLPAITFVYAKTVLSKRPGGYTPPDIPNNHPDLPRKGTAKMWGMKLPIVPMTILLFIAILVSGYMMDSAMKIPAAKLQQMQELAGENKTISQPTILQYVIPLAVAFPIGFFLYAKSINKVKIQDKIFKMELDFKDAMYLMASRLGEKKPLEDAISYVKRFMPESKVATELLENVQRNIMILGLTLKSAIFDPTYGAMKFINSRLMNSAFKIMTDSIELGPEVASTSLIAVSNQIRNVQKINELMRSLLDDVTGMMESMARFIAPVVLGIVASLQQVIIAVVAPLTKGTGGMGASASAGAERGLSTVSGEAMASMASPFEFQLIIGLYIVMLVTILSYFAGKVKYGDNKVAIMMTIGKTLPVSVLVFILALYVGGGLVGGLAG